MAEMTDKKAIENMRMRGCEGFKVLHRRYEGRLKGYLMSSKYYGLDKPTAEDICQDTFFKFMQTINQFKEESGVFTWLCRLARNEVSRYFKDKNRQDDIKKRLTEKQQLGVPLSTEENPDSTKEQPESQSDPQLQEEQEIVFPAEVEKEQCFERCMRQLLAQNANCYQALIFSLEGLSIKEIAKKIGKGIGHDAENRTREFMTRCRKKLKPCVKNCYSIFKWLFNLYHW